MGGILGPIVFPKNSEQANTVGQDVGKQILGPIGEWTGGKAYDALHPDAEKQQQREYRRKQRKEKRQNKREAKRKK